MPTIVESCLCLRMSQPAVQFAFCWTALPSWEPAEDEAVVLFETEGKGSGKKLVLGSNFPYEVYLDGVFAGDGGHRCVPPGLLTTKSGTRRRRRASPSACIG